MTVSKPGHRSRNKNQSCVQRSQNPRNFQKVYYFVFSVFRLTTQYFYCFMIVVLTKTFFLYLTTVQIKTKAFNVKVNCKELRLVLNTECTYIFETVWKSWYSAHLYNIHKCNHLAIITREFVWDNYLQIMFVINILTSLYQFSFVINEIYACATIARTQIYKITLCSRDKFSY